MLHTQELGLLALVRSALKGTQEPLPEDFSLERLLPQIKLHQIWSIALVGAINCGMDSKADSMQKLLGASAQAMSLAENQTAEAQVLFRAFSEAGVDYMPLKGITLRELYPDPNLRSMSDVDILIRMEQYPQIAKIMKAHGFSEGVESDHELNWKKNNVHVELHKCLIPSYNRKLYAYFGDGWDRARMSSGDQNRYEMSDEDFFVYLFTHYAKHFRDGGIGIKHLADLWIYRCVKPEMDEAYIKAELGKMDLDVFYENAMQTVAFWFEDAPGSEMTEHITNVTFHSGIFGDTSAKRNASAVRNSPEGGKKAKLSWTMRLVFLPFGNMCQKYPILHKLPFLLPVMWVVRWVSALFKPKALKKQVKAANSLSSRSIDEYRDSLAYVGLRFEGKE